MNSQDNVSIISILEELHIYHEIMENNFKNIFNVHRRILIIIIILSHLFLLSLIIKLIPLSMIKKSYYFLCIPRYLFITM